MPTTAQRNRYEKKLANASGALYWAASAAEEIGDEGAADDLHKMRALAQEMLEESTRNKRHSTAELPGQMRIGR